MNSKHNLNIENYSIDELNFIFKFNKNETKNNIILKLNEIIGGIDNNLINNEYISFINQVKSKFNNYFNTKNDYDYEYKDIYKDNIKLKSSETNGGYHDIIKDKLTPVNYTHNFLYPAGSVNPVERRVITKTICLDTLFRNNNIQNKLNINSNDVLWVLPFRMDNVISMKLSDIRIPIQYFMFSSKNKNNIFNIKLFNMVDFSDNSIDIIIPDGNYMSNEIVYCLNNYFTNIGQGLQNLYVSFDTYTSHLIIRAKNSNDVNYEIIHYPYDPTSLYYSEDFYFELNFLCDNTLYNNNLHLNAGWLMGFNHPKYIIKKDNLYINNIGFSDTLNNDVIIYYGYCEAEITYGANILNYAFLYIDDYNNNFYNTISSLTYESYIENNIIAKINITSSPNTILFNRYV